YQITGLSHYDDKTQTTTFNGQTSIIVEGVKNGATIQLGQGQNFLRIANPIDTNTVQQSFAPAVLPGVVTIGSNAGHDIIRLYVINHNSVTINSGAGEDWIDVVSSTFKNLTINSDPV